MGSAHSTSPFHDAADEPAPFRLRDAFGINTERFLVVGYGDELLSANV